MQDYIVNYLYKEMLNKPNNLKLTHLYTSQKSMNINASRIYTLNTLSTGNSFDLFSK